MFFFTMYVQKKKKIDTRDNDGDGWMLPSCAAVVGNDALVPRARRNAIKRRPISGDDGVAAAGVGGGGVEEAYIYFNLSVDESIWKIQNKTSNYEQKNRKKKKITPVNNMASAIYFHSYAYGCQCTLVPVPGPCPTGNPNRFSIKKNPHLNPITWRRSNRESIHRIGLWGGGRPIIVTGH